MNQALHFVELRLAGQWSHASRFQERIANLNALCGQLCRPLGLRQIRPRNQHAGGRVAGLPGIAKAFLDALRDGPFEVGIIQNDVGRLASQFLRYPLNRRARAARATAIPARVDPVKETMSISGWAEIAAPTVAPSPFTKLKPPMARQLHAEFARTNTRRVEQFRWA